MAILLGILSAIGAVLFALWRINMAAQAVRGLTEAAGDTRSWFRRKRWQAKASYNAIREVSDPREAAAAMMAAVTQFDGPITEQENTMILKVMTSDFQLEQKVAEELLARGRWLAQDATDISYFLIQLAPPIEKTCDAHEKSKLIAMLTSAASADGAIDSVAEGAIMQLKRRFSV